MTGDELRERNRNTYYYSQKWNLAVVGLAEVLDRLEKMEQLLVNLMPGPHCKMDEEDKDEMDH